jgi:hypothetical protein
MKRLKACRVDSTNGEIHFVLEESPTSVHCKTFKNYEATEIKRISKKEAAKPLVLFREE